MLNHTKKIREMYEDIQRKIYYMIPEKWEELFLYCSVIDMPKGKTEGELYFYYIPKGILKKNPINVYEIPMKFNIDENDYLKLVKVLYDKIKALREEFKKEPGGNWSNMTMIIKNLKFKVEYRYDNLEQSEFSSYDRHIIWRSKYLGIGFNQLNKKERELLRRYEESGEDEYTRKEVYDTGIYIQGIDNKINYADNYNEEQKDIVTKPQNKKIRNQIIFSEEELKNEENK
jgi:hypothetical protein